MSRQSTKPRVRYENPSDAPSAALGRPSLVYTQPSYTFQSVASAAGSVIAEDQHVKCSVSVFGPLPSQSSTSVTDQGTVTAEVEYAPYSHHHLDGHARKTVRQTEAEIGCNSVISSVFSTALQMGSFQKHTILIAVYIHQASACPMYDIAFIINAACLALSTAGFPMYDLVSAASISLVPYLPVTVPLGGPLDDTKDASTSLSPLIVIDKTPYFLSTSPHTALAANLARTSPIVPINLTVAYLPQLGQLIFSKLTGQIKLPTNIVKDPVAHDAQSASEPNSIESDVWTILTTTALDLAQSVRHWHTISLQQFAMDSIHIVDTEPNLE